ncbi:potassium channel family protein [Streptomyces sp. TR06-5]|uniref:potassium channel family protein n=1 Tax=Streptomyces sp. TR06-5 TaxID=3385976 RepID=UPI0039A33C25
MPAFLTLVWARLRGSRWWQRTHVRAAVAGLVVSAVVLLAGSAAILPLEENAPGATLTSYPRALWWSVETATTVGYGDMYPVTAGGRVIAAVVMIVGITTFSVVTAALATWFVGRASRDLRELGATVRRFEQERARSLTAEMQSVHQRFDRLEQRLDDRG